MPARLLGNSGCCDVALHKNLNMKKTIISLSLIICTLSSFAQTASYVLNAVSSSFAASANNANLLDGLDSTVFATTGSNTFTGTQVVSGSLRLFESASFTLPTSQPATAVAGTAFFSGSFLYIYNGTAYKSASLS